MIHFSCDRCRRVIDPEDDMRYVVKLEVHAAMEPLDVFDADGDRDHLLEIHECLERMDELEGDVAGDEVCQQRHFDLCRECYRKYMKNPLGRELVAHQLDFSQN